MPSPTRPPRLAEWLLDHLAEPVERRSLLADLEEGLVRRARRESPARARRWYWRQAAILTVALAGARLGSAFTSGALVLDAKRALRSLRRSPGMTAAAVITLGLGIAGPTAAFGIITAMFSPLPVEEPRDVVAVDLLDQETGRTFAATWSIFASWRETASGLEAIGAYDDHDQAVSGAGFAPTRVPSVRVTPGLLDVLGVEPLVGRLLVGEDARSAATPAALIREDLWEAWFDRSPSAIGTLVTVGRDQFTVVGVMPASFGFPEAHQLWTSLKTPVDGNLRVDVVGRLARGRTADSVEPELLPTVSALTVDGSRTYVQVEEFVLAQHGPRTLALLWGLNLLVGLLVVIAAANVSALFLARGLTRTSETALRMATGGGRWAVMRPLAFEALVVSALGATAGVLGAQGVVEWMGRTLEARGTLPYWADLSLSPAVLGFALTLMLGATIVAGVLPAIRTTRVDLAHAMKSEGRGGSRERVPVLSTLVTIEVALACVLLITSSVAVRGALGTMQWVGAFPTDGVLTAGLQLESFAYPNDDARARFWNGLSEALSEDPSVESFALASAMPGDGTSDAWIAIDDARYERPEDWPRSQRRVVTPGFFEMFDMEVVSGRTFREADDDRAPRVAVVNDAWVEQHLDGASPVGRKLRVRERVGDPVDYEIVGQVRDDGVSVDDGERVAAFFLPVAQRRPVQLRTALRLHAGGQPPLEALTSHVHALDPELPLDAVMTLEALVRRENDGARVMGGLFGSLGLAALLLAIVGLHGVVTFMTTQRTHVIGVMRALGAPEGRVLSDVLRSGLRPVAIGLAVGLIFSWLLTPLVSQELLAEASTGPHDPLIFGLVPLVLLAGAVAAVTRPALLASRVDPVSALRAE